MAEKDIIRRSLREVKRLKVIQETIEKQITQRVAASMTGLSERRTRRLVRAVKELEVGVIHSILLRQREEWKGFLESFRTDLLRR